MEAPATISIVEPLPAPVEAKIDEEAIKVLVDLAIRRHDQLEKAYDTLNTRVGVIFGFSGFIAAAFFKAAELLPGKWFQISACTLFAISVVFLAWQCKQAFGVAEFEGFPPTDVLTRDFAYRAPLDLRLNLIRRLTSAYDANLSIYTRKANRLQVAIIIMFFQTALILAVFVVAAGAKLASDWSQLTALFQP